MHYIGAHHSLLCQSNLIFTSLVFWETRGYFEHILSFLCTLLSFFVWIFSSSSHSSHRWCNHWHSQKKTFFFEVYTGYGGNGKHKEEVLLKHGKVHFEEDFLPYISDLTKVGVDDRYSGSIASHSCKEFLQHASLISCI